MRFHADLHVHSKHSRATSRDLDLDHLAHWAARKGLGVVATGDFTHPVWRAELKEKLVPAGPGVFRLKPEIERALAATLPAACRTLPRFLLEVEISTIYKKGDRTRKIHHLIYAPDFATVDRIGARLARIGNIASDGRPILGLDSRDLLEIVLEASEDAYLIPAHIWTPWFAVLGSQSGFDSVAECYGDLAEHIFAVETGLSSDPAMNWRLSMLDRYRLTSSSDAHSPAKLGREATTFDCEPDYFSIRRALETGAGYAGTVEFFPEEGKYHLDGHRKCGTRLAPAETIRHRGRCPTCGDAVTVGVLHRVETLADRSAAEAKPPATAGRVSSLVPLAEMIAEIVRSGPSSQTVARSYDRLVSTLGPELDVLERVPLEDVARGDSEVLAEAIRRLRAGKVIRESGYDGEYGNIRLFEDGELARLAGRGFLFAAPVARKPAARKEKKDKAKAPKPAAASPAPKPAAPVRTNASRAGERGGAGKKGVLAELDESQRAAAEAVEGPVLIVAGPGSGKTRTLTHRIAHLVLERRVPADQCLALTFSRRAAGELRERLVALLGDRAREVATHTFHSFGLSILRAHPEAAGLQPDFRIASGAERVAALSEALDRTARATGRSLRAISRAKRAQTGAAEKLTKTMSAYDRALAARNSVDFDDLIGLTVRALGERPALAAKYRARYRWISVDEFQDIDEQQYRLLSLLAPPGANVCAIGDPDQSIYGFRGADASCFERFRRDHPGARLVRLPRNYRSSGTIVTASAQVIGTPAAAGTESIVREMAERITVHVAPTDKAEAEFVVHSIEQMLGGHTFFSIDSGRTEGGRRMELGFSDFAVLYRTDAQAAALCEAFVRSGLPFKRHSHEPLADEPAVRTLLAEVEREADERALAIRIQAAASRVREGGKSDSAAVALAMQRLIALAESVEGDFVHFRDALAVATEADFWDARADRVSLLTLHAAKGLEFPVVFVTGLEDGVLPLHWGASEEASLAEERRLFYVGMTRAKDRLVLTRALKRPWRGQIRPLAPSPFLDAIEAELTRIAESSTRRDPDRQLKLL